MCVPWPRPRPTRRTCPRASHRDELLHERGQPEFDEGLRVYPGLSVAINVRNDRPHSAKIERREYDTQASSLGLLHHEARSSFAIIFEALFC